MFVWIPSRKLMTSMVAFFFTSDRFIRFLWAYMLFPADIAALVQCNSRMHNTVCFSVELVLLFLQSNWVLWRLKMLVRSIHYNLYNLRILQNFGLYAWTIARRTDQTLFQKTKESPSSQYCVLLFVFRFFFAFASISRAFCRNSCCFDVLLRTDSLILNRVSLVMFVFLSHFELSHQRNFRILSPKQHFYSRNSVNKTESQFLHISLFW